MDSAIRDFFIYVDKENLVEVFILCVIVSIFISIVDMCLEIWRIKHE